VNRRLNPPPTLPDTVPPVQRRAAKASHILLYASMVAMPLVGWGMLSAERYPIVLYGPLQLPAYASKSGKSIIAARSTAAKGNISRIVARLDGPVTTPPRVQPRQQRHATTRNSARN
jgi:cytochrome b561